MSLSLQQLAAALEIEFRGDGEILIHGVSSASSARPGDLCFVLGEKQLASVAGSACTALVLPPGLADKAGDKALLLSSKPHFHFIGAIRALELEPPALPAGVHPSAQVADTAQIGHGVRIGANAVIEDAVSIGADSIIGSGCVVEHSASIGRDCLLHSNVTVAHGVRMGDRCILHSGAVIGGDGFGLIMHEDEWMKVPQIGSVVLEDDVEVGASTTIDRGALDDTVIEKGVKIDNLVMIAHNCRIGAHTAIAGCVGIAGSATIGRYCKISGSANINGHITIADHTTISATAMVTASIPEAGVYSSGIPAMENSLWLRLSARYKGLDKLTRSVARLEKLVNKDTADNS